VLSSDVLAPWALFLFLGACRGVGITVGDLGFLRRRFAASVVAAAVLGFGLGPLTQLIGCKVSVKIPSQFGDSY
jgi:hypothetical protein